MAVGLGSKKALEKIAEMRKKQKQKKMGTPKFAPGKGGGSDAARKGKGAVGGRKPKKLPEGLREFLEKNKRKSPNQKFQRAKLNKGGRPGLYANIHAKRKSGRPMRKKGDKGAPTAANFARAKQTVKKK